MGWKIISEIVIQSSIKYTKLKLSVFKLSIFYEYPLNPIYDNDRYYKFQNAQFLPTLKCTFWATAVIEQIKNELCINLLSSISFSPFSSSLRLFLSLLPLPLFCSLLSSVLFYSLLISLHLTFFYFLLSSPLFYYLLYFLILSYIISPPFFRPPPPFLSSLLLFPSLLNLSLTYHAAGHFMYKKY